MALAAAYDAVNTAIFLPAGGSRRVRQSLVDALAVRPGQRVLELGCGTGQVTARLLAAGAHVVAVDELPAMLARARRRAPQATFVEGDAVDADVGGDYDLVVLSFVLHNFDADGRIRLLRRAKAALTETGRIGVLEWARPHGRVRGALWGRFLNLLEPAPTAQEVLAGALDTAIPAAALQVDHRRQAAGGRTQILVVSRRSTTTSGDLSVARLSTSG